MGTVVLSLLRMMVWLTVAFFVGHVLWDAFVKIAYWAKDALHPYAVDSFLICVGLTFIGIMLGVMWTMNRVSELITYTWEWFWANARARKVS